MDKDMFLAWIRHFTTHVKPSPDRPVLLIMDGHASHTRSLAAIDYARENGIVMLSLPPHSTHRLQPLDVSFFKPLQSFYIQEQETWLRTNPGRKITAFQIAGLFNKAYVRAASTATATKGFEKTGIWLCNRHVFSEVDFFPSMEDFDAFNIPVGQSSSPANSFHIPFRPTVQESPFHQARPSSEPARPDPEPPRPPSEPSRPSSEPAGFPSEPAGPPSEPAGHCYEGTEQPAYPPPEPPSPCSEQDIGLILALPNKTVIQTNPDGRCFFRSIVIGNNVALQSAQRDGNGLAVECQTRIQEQIQADALRGKMISHMLNNIEGFRPVSAAVNSDMSSSVAFSSLEERILHMANPTSPVGEMEISATSEVLQQPIHIINAKFGNIVKYKDDSFPLAQPVSVLYSPHGDNAGHYDCVLGFAVSVSLISPSPSVSQQKLAATRKARKTEAEIITSSPYKHKLIVSLANQKTTKKTKPNTENREKQKAENKRA